MISPVSISTSLAANHLNWNKPLLNLSRFLLLYHFLTNSRIRPILSCGTTSISSIIPLNKIMSLLGHTLLTVLGFTRISTQDKIISSPRLNLSFTLHMTHKDIILSNLFFFWLGRTTFSSSQLDSFTHSLALLYLPNPGFAFCPCFAPCCNTFNELPYITAYISLPSVGWNPT